MKRILGLTLLLFLVSASWALAAQSKHCIACHKGHTPNIVSDWELSQHSKNDIGCADCHGSKHNSRKNVDLVQLPTPATCGTCHPQRVEEYKKGKHSLAWVAMNVMPTTHAQPMALIEGQKGCGGCHKIGMKSEEEIKALKAKGLTYGASACDSCHTRHTFSVKEASEPQACQTCHMGFDHPQWEMWSSSKHGVRYLLKQLGKLPEGTAAPKCQTCHMQEGNHEVRTGWGFLAVRLPLPEDPQWKADQVTILQALGVLDPDGKPTGRLDVVKAGDVARLTQEDFDRERKKMIKTCSQCHSDKFAIGEITKAEQVLKEADHLLAEAIRIIAALYQEGVLKKPAEYAYAFPDLLTFHDAPTVIEQRLFEMHLKHRMRAFQGAFHANPDYALWYGWSEMVRDLADIQHMAKELRAEKAM